MFKNKEYRKSAYHVALIKTSKAGILRDKVEFEVRNITGMKKIL